LDGYGKADLAISNWQANSLSILRNKIGEPQPLAICAAGNVTTSGTVVLNSTTTIRSLKLSPGANLEVNAGVTHTITH
jgi:hypothetical protein